MKVLQMVALTRFKKLINTKVESTLELKFPQLLKFESKTDRSSIKITIL